MRHERFDRTAELINLDFFGGQADKLAIAAALGGTTVPIVADARNLQSPNGQTTTVTTAIGVAMMGLAVDLDLATTRLLRPEPPLLGDDLQSGLGGYLADLGGMAQAGSEPALTIGIGDTPIRGGGAAVRLGADDWAAALDRSGADIRPIRGTLPFGSIAVAGAACAEALRAAAPAIAALVGLTLPAQWSWSVPTPVATDLGPGGMLPARVDVGPVDFISGGAITNASIYTLARVPGLVGTGRVMDSDRLEWPNLNRYFMCTPADVGHMKSAVLQGMALPGFPITGIDIPFNADTAARIGDLRPRVLLGVDHIPSRWFVQRRRPDWLCVGATGHLYSLVSTHTRDTACAGCVHASDDPADGPVPTISFVSLWSGLLQARELVLEAAGLQPWWSATEVYPFGLFGARALRPYVAGRSPRCPVGHDGAQAA